MSSDAAVAGLEEGEGEGEVADGNSSGTNAGAAVSAGAQGDDAQHEANLESLLHLPGASAKVKYDVRMPHPRDEPQLRTVRTR